MKIVLISFVTINAKLEFNFFIGILNLISQLFLILGPINRQYVCQGPVPCVLCSTNVNNST